MAIRREQRPNFGRKMERAIRRVEQEDRYEGMNDKEILRDNLVHERIRGLMAEYYQGVDPRRRKELADGGIVQEDHNAMANLSPRFIHQEYPRFSFFSTMFNDAIMQGNENE